MCHVCGKVMRDDNLKRHMDMKHGGSNIETRQPKPACSSADSLGHTSCEDEAPVEKNGHKTPKDTLEFELEQNYEAYKKNVEMGELISSILNEKRIMEESLSKQYKFCLEIFRTQKPAME